MGGIGPSSDSFYEYLYKSYVLFGDTEYWYVLFDDTEYWDVYADVVSGMCLQMSFVFVLGALTCTLLTVYVLIFITVDHVFPLTIFSR